MKRAKYKKFRRNPGLRLPGAALTVVIFIFSGIFLFWGNTKEALPVPAIADVGLPPVLFLPHLTTNVLGTQAIRAEDVVKYVNIERTKRGESSLIINDKLMQAAKMRTEVILTHQNFSHQDPYEGIELTTVLPKVGYFYSYASENIGMGGISGEDFVGGFMNSASHRLNLLNPSLYHTGVAIVTGPFEKYYVNIAVQLFGIPASHEDYLGYNSSDRSKYRNLLIKAKIRTNPAVVFAEKLLKKDDTGISKMERQKEILAKLSAKMDSGLPFSQSEVDMVKEFNSYL